jgi:fructosamine-3-kinase
MMTDILIAEALHQAGDDTPIAERAVVGGGSISQALRLRTARGEYLLKAGGRGLPGFFTAEARGLALLASAGAVRVPAVLAYRDARLLADQSDEDRGWRIEDRKLPSSILYPPSSKNQDVSIIDEGGFILLEWLAPPPHADRARAGELLGAALAAMHRTTAPSYGLDHDNYIGTTPQQNGPMASWLAFFRERRLGFQAELARQNGHTRAERARRLERLLDRLSEWIDDRAIQPALLHGDLWGGNFIVGPGGAPVLIDPAAYYGDREADLAMTRLFGGFPPGFYRAYEAAWPLPSGWRERVGVYNLYHLLNHLNLFGESYGAEVDATLAQYVG